ncbi:MAG: amino acid ABC transporter substrate-binding protein [Magnetococcales bacterium]|nr:amino acid ABC transporter substrate-binding protein [Magnetococcales bacterium]
MVVISTAQAAGDPSPAVGKAVPATPGSSPDKKTDIDSLTREFGQVPIDIGRILRRGRLIVAMIAKDQPPFVMKNKQGDLMGLDVKIAQGIADQLGVKVEFNRKATTFNGVVDLVEKGEADIGISKLSRTLERAKKVLFSQPYIVLRQGLIINRLGLAKQAYGRPVSDVLQDLKGKIGVIQGTSYEEFARQKFPQATVVPFQDWDQIVDAVFRGEILAAYRDELAVKKTVKSKPEASIDLRIVILPKSFDPIVVALPWYSTHFRDLINLYLETIKLDATTDKLLDQWVEFESQP